VGTGADAIIRSAAGEEARKGKRLVGGWAMAPSGPWEFGNWQRQPARRGAGPVVWCATRPEGKGHPSWVADGGLGLTALASCPPERVGIFRPLGSVRALTGKTRFRALRPVLKKRPFR
jgi:hypothetical protein